MSEPLIRSGATPFRLLHDSAPNPLPPMDPFAPLPADYAEWTRLLANLNAACLEDQGFGPKAAEATKAMDAFIATRLPGYQPEQ